MEIRESATYPYPIWGLHGAYLSEDPVKGSRSADVDVDANVLNLQYIVTCHESGIDRLISERKAAYQCIVECPYTYYLLHQEFTEPSFCISIPLEQIYRRCSVKIIIVATQEIAGCDFLNIDEVYEGIVDFPKGAVLASIDDFIIPLQQSNSAADLSKIICVMSSEVDNVKFDFSGQRIVVKIPLDYDTRFNRVDDLCPGVVEASLVYPALVQAIFKLREAPDMSRDWVFYLTRYLQELNEEGFITLQDEEYILELEDIYLVVDKLLSKPLLRAIDDTTKQLS